MSGLFKELLQQLEKVNSFKNNLKSNLIENNQIFEIIMMFQREYLNSTENIQRLIHAAYDDLKSVNRNAEDVAGLVNKSSEIIQNNIRSSKRNISAMTDAADAVDKLEKGFQNLQSVFSSLNDSIRMIVERIDVIEDISELTNLLALNAAIEAARAGEKGRGFQVVAKEIRKLADRSRSNTSEISGVLKNLNDRLNDAGNFLDEYAGLQKNVLEQISETGGSLAESRDELELIDNEINSINNLVERQAASTASLIESLDSVNSSSEFTVKNAPFIDKAIDIYINTEKSSRIDLDGIDSLLKDSGQILDSEAGSGSSEVVIGHDIADPPWCYIKDGASAGISIDYSKEFFRKRNASVSFSGGQWADIYSNLMDGSIDIIANVGWPNQFFKNEPVTASPPYDRFNIRIFAKSADTSDASFFKGRKIGVQKGSFAEDVAAGLGCEPVVFENDIQAMVQLLWNNIDGIATEERVGAYISEHLFLGAVKPVSDIVASLDVVYLMLKKFVFCGIIQVIQEDFWQRML